MESRSLGEVFEAKLNRAISQSQHVLNHFVGTIESEILYSLKVPSHTFDGGDNASGYNGSCPFSGD